MNFIENSKKFLNKFIGKKETEEINLNIDLKSINPIAPAQYEFLIENNIPTVEISVINPWQKDIEDFQVKVRLQDVSDWVSKTHVNVKKTDRTIISMVIPVSPEKLYNYEEENLSLDIYCTYTNPMNKKREFSDSKLIKILAKDDMIWAIEKDGKVHDLSHFIAAWVTPRDPEVQKLIHNAAENPEAKSIGGIIGYQSAKKSETQSKEIVVPPNELKYHKIHLRRGASLSGVLKAVTGGANNDINFYFFESNNFILFKDGKNFQYYLGETKANSGYSFNFISPIENDYYLVLDNRFSTISDKIVGIVYKIETPLSQNEIVGLQAKAMYETIKQNGMNYVHTPVSFAPGNSQRVKRPSDTLKFKGGNCIDGSVLFASCFEAIGFLPSIAIIPGHAFVCIKTWGDSNNYIFIETTAVSAFNFDKALIPQQEVFSKYKDNLKLIDIKKARELGTLTRII
ncbi:MAG: hypothetical protein Q7U60_11420 [Candidatus Methanoperedens sp.]|nr:hypothetical protein [Candidatus Methanoperedens sp.]